MRLGTRSLDDFMHKKCMKSSKLRVPKRMNSVRSLFKECSGSITVQLQVINTNMCSTYVSLHCVWFSDSLLGVVGKVPVPG